MSMSGYQSDAGRQGSMPTNASLARSNNGQAYAAADATSTQMAFQALRSRRRQPAAQQHDAVPRRSTSTSPCRACSRRAAERSQCDAVAAAIACRLDARDRRRPGLPPHRGKRSAVPRAGLRLDPIRGTRCHAAGATRRRPHFWRQQFRAQHAHYQKYYPDADWLVTMHGARTSAVSISSAGRPSIASSTSPSCRSIAGKGFGEALLRDLMDEAAAAGKAVSIHVEKFNPAMRLYRRLGFADRGRQGRLRSDALDRRRD